MYNRVDIVNYGCYSTSITKRTNRTDIEGVMIYDDAWYFWRELIE